MHSQVMPCVGGCYSKKCLTRASPCVRGPGNRGRPLTEGSPPRGSTPVGGVVTEVQI